MTATLDDPLLGPPLPVDDPADAARTADGLVDGRRPGGRPRAPVGLDAAGAAMVRRRLRRGRPTAGCSPPSRCGRNARRMLARGARSSAGSAGRSLRRRRWPTRRAGCSPPRGPPRRRPTSRDRRCGAGRSGWGDNRADGRFHDPHAVALLHRARERAAESRHLLRPGGPPSHRRAHRAVRSPGGPGRHVGPHLARRRRLRPRRRRRRGRASTPPSTSHRAAGPTGC